MTGRRVLSSRPMARAATGVGVVRGVAAVLAAPWLFRALAVFEAPTAPTTANLRGIAADLAVGMALLAGLWFLARWARWLGVLLVGLLALGYYANYETITGLGTVASTLDLAFLADPTFLRGSAFALAHPLALAAVLIASLALAWHGLRGASTADTLLAVAGAGLLLGGPPTRATRSGARSTPWRTTCHGLPAHPTSTRAAFRTRPTRCANSSPASPPTWTHRSASSSRAPAGTSC